jgi:hypothetical protein
MEIGVRLGFGAQAFRSVLDPSATISSAGGVLTRAGFDVAFADAYTRTRPFDGMGGAPFGTDVGWLALRLHGESG